MGFVEEVRGVLPRGAVVVDPDALEAYRRDQAGLVEAGNALAALLPTTTAEVAGIVRIAGRHRVPLVPRGAGSGLAGGANAVDGAAVVSLERMDRILAVDTDDLTATVQPGVLNATLSRTVEGLGLWYPPDPASWEFSTIGGNVATNAGGLCCVRYGVTGDFVLELEVVLAGGEVARVGRRTVKGVAGYDLASLFVGSEGTLGIVTEITVRLRPPPPPTTTLVATFDDVASAGAAIAAVIRRFVPTVLEIMDATTLRAVDDWKHMGLADAAALVILRAEGSGHELDALSGSCTAAGATYVAATTDPAEAELLLEARRLAYPALERLGTTLLDDVAVPRSRIPQLLVGVDRIAARHGVLIGTFGHAGDGNMHPTIVYEPPQLDAAREAFEDILRLALRLGGTLTGEHGVGTLKRRQLPDELGGGALDLMRRVKDAVDPDGLFNPGKVLPDAPTVVPVPRG